MSGPHIARIPGRRRCADCGGWFRKREGSGWVTWRCHPCMSLRALDSRRADPMERHEHVAELPPAGWMRDPHDTSADPGERWWDGTDWTSHTR
jgi:Protein of unknown function (DUF2510)